MAVALLFSCAQRRRGAFLLVFMLWGSLISLSCAARLSVSRQKLEVEKHLKRVNKPPIKSIESADGDIIDCVHISQQPAFDHPFLKDHKIQMRPSYHPEGLYDEDKMSTRSKESTNPITQLWHMNGRCPEDTIPVRRTKKDDILRASSVKSYGKKKHKAIPKPRSTDPDLTNESGHQHAIAYVEGDKYYRAKVNVRLALTSMVTITQDCSLTGLVMHIKQQAAKIFSAQVSFKSAVQLLWEQTPLLFQP